MTRANPISVGQRVRERQNGHRWQVVDVAPRELTLRPMEYRATLDGRGPMAWVAVYWQGENTRRVTRDVFAFAYEPDDEARP